MRAELSHTSSITTAFSETVARYASNIAVSSGDEKLTYADLDARSDSLALKLMEAGARAGANVGIAADLASETIVALLAILKSGAAYVPLAPDMKAARLGLIANDAAIDFAVGEIAGLADVRQGVVTIVPDAGDASHARQVLPVQTPDAVAYVMYTSGSTGTPKGVAIAHRGVLRLVRGQAFMRLGPQERILLNSPMSFDASTLEIWGALLNGGTLVIPDARARSLRGLGEVIAEERISTLWLTAGLFHAMADERPGDFAPLHQLLTGGDVVSPVKAARVLRACPELQLINGYGPTENTTFTCCHRITPAEAETGRPLPIGKPINGTDVHILDAALNPVADGSPGELCAAGLGLAVGYLNLPEQTAAKFVAAPWDNALKLYRTGDLARRDASGIIHYEGRLDTQVKIRGLRVELGAIETAMESFPDVAQAAAVAVTAGDSADKMIVAFHSGGANEAALAGHLAARLEAHEMPARLIALDALPLNANGKVDRRALEQRVRPVENRERRDTGADPQRIETALARAFAEVLGIDDVDAAVNFFDLGASSLHIARVHERMQTALGRTIEISDFFRHTTIAALAAHFGGRSIPQGRPETEPSPLRAGLGDIAIVGMAGRFPGARSVDEFWQALVEGRELISHFAEDELDIQPPAGADRSSYVYARGVMPDAELFDAKHFGIPPREAERMDPQHRILLEVAQTALENAGIDPERFAGKIGIFAGSSQNSYLLNNLLSAPGATRAFAAGYPVQDFATLFGNDKDFIVTRIAYKLNLNGPAVTVLSACSTSLVAVGQACDALRSGAADAVLAGGVSITFPSRRPYLYQPDGMASNDGHCRTFDADATGTVFGDGAGMVVLRRLEDALADGSDIVAVIRGHAVNNDGSDKIGYAAPSITAQADVIRAAHRAARVAPEEIGYVETHGTGTPLGDPIEFSALTEAFGNCGGRTALGSAKTNVGHLDIAAGITGLIKTALTLKHGVIPPLLHFRAPNPRIRFEGTPFHPVTEATEWKQGEKRRIAGVSAFGVGGTNAHVVIEEAPRIAAERLPVISSLSRIFPVSASSREALAAAVADLGRWAERNPKANRDEVVETLRFGRRHHAERAVLVARSMTELAAAARSGSVKPVSSRPRERVAFLFPGQGAQHVGMARDLYTAEAVFRDALDRCAELLRPELGLNILDVMHGRGLSEEEAAARLMDTALAQPAIFSISFALAQQWKRWGIEPDALIGHSVGEFAAATIAGCMELPDALRLVALRGRLISQLPRGTMISVRASEQEIAPFLSQGLDLAAVNGARSCVLAGPDEAVLDAMPRLEAAGFIAARLQTSHAFHSRMMDPALAEFRAAVARVPLAAPRLPILSTVTGAWLTDGEATDPEYWVGHMRRPVRFHDAIRQMWADGSHVLIETGPGRNLTMLAAQAPDLKTPVAAIASLPHAQAASTDSGQSMREALGLLWAHGYPVDWSRIDPHAGQRRRASGLPTYPFQRKQFWVEPWSSGEAPAASAAEVAAPAAPVEAKPDAEAPAISAIDALRTLLFDLSGVDPQDMPADAGFVELGFDSLLLTQVTRELSERFGVKVTLRQLVDGFDTLGALAAHIEASGRIGAAKTAATAPLAVAEPVLTESPSESSAPMTVLTRESQEVTAGQRAHIAALTERFTAKTAKSKQLTARYRPFHADPRTASGFNRLWKEIVYQIVTVKSKGSRLIDVDGNEYVDLLNGFGPGFLGHSPDQVVKAVEDQLHAGFEVGPQSLAAMEAAALFCEVTGNDRASFVCTGSEAVYAAMRLARTVTGRDRIVMFARDYHGNFDEVLVRGIDAKDGPRTMPLAPGIPRDAVKNVVVLPYGTPQALDWIRANADTLAAVIVEPVQSRRPDFRPADFIREVRRITEQSDTVFIFDEVVTGFRFGPRGAQDYYGVKADLVTYGKVVGGGMPIGIVSGKARLMDTFDGGQWGYGDDSFPSAPVTFFAGTFVRHPLAMASLKAMLTFFKSQPDFFWKTVNAKGDRLAKSVDRWFAENDMPFSMPNCGSLMYLHIGEDQKFGGLLGAHMRDRGVFLLEGFPSYVTAAHDDEDIAHVVEAFKDSALEMRAANMIGGREAPDYRGPRVRSAPPRLSLPGGEARIAEAMARPLAPLSVPATEAQREIWAAMIITPELAPAYNESVSLKMRGPVDRDALVEATRQGLARHDALRSTFSEDGTEMIVHPRLSIPVELVDLSGLSPEERARRLADMLADETQESFDISNGPLARARLVALGDLEHQLIITAHHIVCDGWSIDVVMRDIGRIYSALREGRAPALETPLSIIDYARAEQEWSTTADAAATRSYWLGRFAGELPVLDLPTDHPRAAVRTVRSERLDRSLPQPLVARLRKLARSQGATFVNTMLAAYTMLVAGLARTSDMVIGLPASGQAARGMPTVVGHCVNLLPIRTQIDFGKGFADHLKTVRRAMLDAFDHQTFTYGELVRELRVPRDPSRVMLVPVIFNIDNGIDLSGMSFGPVEIDFFTNPRTSENFELYLNMTDGPDEVRTEWSYNADLFDRATISGHVDRFVELLDRLCDDPDRPLDRLIETDVCATPEIWQGRRVEIARQATLAGLFAGRVAAAPNDTALIEGGRLVSYAALDAEANAIARRLAARGVVKDDIVGICLDRSARMVASMLAAMRLGAAYLPLDPSNPPERLSWIVADSRARAVVSTAALAARLGLAESTLVRADDLGEAEIASARPVTPVPSDIAYVVYTSGSTGRPKGVLGTQLATVNRFAWMWREFPFAPGEVMCQKTPISFVDSVWEIFGPLLAGVPQVIIDNETVRDPQRFLDALGAQGVTRLLVVPSLLRAVVESGIDIAAAAPALRYLFTSGERIPAELARDFLAAAPHITLVNLYGSSEVAADVTCEIVRDVPPGDVPIGLPIDNARLYVLDQHRQPVATGGAGELYVGGEVLAGGYLHRADLTAERFMPDPFSGEPAARMFATGDRVRRLTDGRLVYLGRTDHQVKIRGARVELGEVEAALAGMPEIAEAVVVARPDSAGEAMLVGYVTGKEGSRPHPQSLRDALSRTLPDYMVPARITVLDKMPLNPNGKSDRAALAARPLDINADDKAAAQPSTPLERALCQVWSNVLEVANVGVHDNFFELGGHSLLAVKLFGRIRRELRVDLPISTLLSHPTVASLARTIEDHEKKAAAGALAADASPDAPWDTTTVIHPGPPGGAAPLFIVGGVGGNVNNLRELGRVVGRSRPVIGLQTRGIMGHRLHETIEAAAADHLQHVRRRQPKGPYYLAGYSGGAYTAFEIARQLKAAGEGVAFLGILDMEAPGFEPESGVSPLGRLKFELSIFRAHGLPGTVARARSALDNWLERSRETKQISGLDAESQRMMRVRQAWPDVSARYRPAPYDGDAWILLAQPDSFHSAVYHESDPQLGWQKLVLGRRVFASHDAGHNTMLVGHAVETLGRMIAEAIEGGVGA